MKKEIRMSTSHLEPRVAKLETGLDILTRNVTDLTIAVRDNTANLDDKLERLTVAVTQAQSPRRTDWGTIISGVFLILAIGSAVFWPLNQTAQDNKTAILDLSLKFEQHQQLDNHPVGAILMNRVEEQVRTHISNNEKQNEALLTHFHEEIVAAKEHLETQLKDSSKLQDMINERLIAKLLVLEEQNKLDVEREKDELTQWRMKAMGLISSAEPPSGHSHLDMKTPDTTCSPNKKR